MGNELMRDVGVKGLFSYLARHGLEMREDGSIEEFQDVIADLRRRGVLEETEALFLEQAIDFGENFEPAVEVPAVE